MAAAVETSIAKKLDGQLLEKAGGEILGKLVGLAFDAVLQNFGLGGDDTSAQLSAISQKLDEISNQIKDLSDEVQSLSLDGRIDNCNNQVADIEDLFLDVVATMRSYAKTQGTSTTLADIRNLRARIINANIRAKAEKLHAAMCGELKQTGVLELEWKEILHGQHAVPDPMDAYMAIKSFSLHYQASMAHAMCLFKFVAHTTWTEADTAKLTAAQIEDRPEMEKVRSIADMITDWDNKLEKGSNPIIDQLILRMADQFLNDKSEGLQVFWDRSNKWGVGVYTIMRYFFKDPKCVYLHDPRCFDKSDLVSAPFIFYNKSEGTYNIRFRRDDGGWTDIAPTNLLNNIPSIPLLVQRLHMESFRLEDSSQYTKPQPYKLQMIARPSDKEPNIWFYIHLAGPAPVVPGFNDISSWDNRNRNTTEYLMRYKLQATAEGDKYLRTNDDNAGQYDTEFTFRLA